MPLTYYDNVAENLFTRGRKDNPFLAELMRLYLSRPDLVAGTDRALRSQQTKPLRPRPMLHWHQANPNLCRWLLLRKDLLQEVHRLITARK